MATNTVRLGGTYKHDSGVVMILEAGSSVTADNFVELVEFHQYLNDGFCHKWRGAWITFLAEWSLCDSNK